MAGMRIDGLFFKLFKVSAAGSPIAYLGTAFAVRPNGGMLTCRHVVDIELGDGESVCLLDEQEGSRLVPVEERLFSADPTLDACFLPDALKRRAEPYFPILPPGSLRPGGDVYSFGYFLADGDRTSTQHGYFKGNIVNVNRPAAKTAMAITLSYPIIEGLSGSPVLTYHNGPKAVGLAFGSISSRVTASEIVEFENDKMKLRETVLRIVEFGLAYGSDALARLDSELGIGLTMTDERLAVPGLE